MPEGNRTAGLAQALKALADGEVASAAGVAANLLRAWPQDASVQQLMAAVAWRQSRPLEAERWALSSLALRPGHFATLMLAADAARANGDMTSARERYARAEEITPTRPEAAFGAAVATITIDPVLAPDAVAALRRRFPDPSPAWAQIGAACERAEQGQLASREADWRDRRRR